MTVFLPEGLEFRSAASADARAIASLTDRAYARWVAVIGRKPLPMQVDYAAAVGAHRFDGVWDSDELVGVVETTPEDDSLLIVNVAVDPGWQGRGVGRWLLAYAEQLAVAAGFRRIRLYTNVLFEVNIALYASVGYAEERREAMNGGTVVHMVKELA
ncbi:GNAT family N-acetyltransferase [Mycolicibacterium sp. CBM1]